MVKKQEFFICCDFELRKVKKSLKFSVFTNFFQNFVQIKAIFRLFLSKSKKVGEVGEKSKSRREVGEMGKKQEKQESRRLWTPWYYIFILHNSIIFKLRVIYIKYYTHKCAISRYMPASAIYISIYQLSILTEAEG